MSLPDRKRAGRLGAGLALLALAAVAGCTVRPMYGDVTSSTAPSGVSAARLASVEVRPAEDRVGQEVRNHLIFMLAGGAGQPANPTYTLALTTSAFRTSAASVQQTTRDLEPTAAVVTVRSSYVLTETATGTRLGAGLRSVQAPYDVSRQSFAAIRAQRDAENRAARELAEQLRLAVAHELERPSSGVAPAVVSAPQELEGFSAEEEDGSTLVQQ